MFMLYFQKIASSMYMMYMAHVHIYKDISKFLFKHTTAIPGLWRKEGPYVWANTPLLLDLFRIK